MPFQNFTNLGQFNIAHSQKTHNGNLLIFGHSSFIFSFYQPLPHPPPPHHTLFQVIHCENSWSKGRHENHTVPNGHPLLGLRVSSRVTDRGRKHLKDFTSAMATEKDSINFRLQYPRLPWFFPSFKPKSLVYHLSKNSTSAFTFSLKPSVLVFITCNERIIMK